MLISVLTHGALLGLLMLSATQVPQEMVEIHLMEFPSEKVGSEAESPVTAPRVQSSREDAVSPMMESDPLAVKSQEKSQEVVGEKRQASGGSTGEVVARNSYQSHLMQLLNAKKFYPPMAKKLRQQGVVMVRFRISKDGHVLEARVIGPSPFPTLNESAKSLVQSLKAIKPFPKDVQANTWLFDVPVKYQM
tara:strand:- start:1635 stop:2207 length:573 start_codon:yes stop_codon:yes gene_type:complete